MRLRRVCYSHVAEIRLFMKLFLTASPAVVKCCQLDFNFLPAHSQRDILQEFIAPEKRLCYLLLLTAHRK